MKTINKSICAVVAATLAIGGYVAGNQRGYQSAENVYAQPQTITGKPLGAEKSYSLDNNLGYGIFTTMLDVNGKKVLCTGGSNRSADLTEAVTLVQSEMNDEDDEFVELTGKYTADGRFRVISLTSNGYTVEFNK